MEARRSTALPDGRSIVFARQVYDWDANAISINLWLVPRGARRGV
jgi:hypothetical protein